MPDYCGCIVGGGVGGTMNDRLTHLSLFSGIGGLDLAAEWASFRTVGQCEWADYPTKILEKHWPDVPRWRDIRALTKENFYERTGLRTVDVISGGFPCQPFSVAGKRRGKEDDRYLWPEMLRVIGELRPTWVVGENVANIVNMELDQVLSDLENQGYQTRAFVFPACSVDAPHRRGRCAIVANAESGGLQGIRACWEQERRTRHEKKESERCCDVLSDTNDGGGALRRDGELQPTENLGGSWGDHRGTEEHGSRERRTVEPELGGGHDGLSAWMDGVRAGWADGTWEAEIPRIAANVPDRVSRLKCLGNAVVPQQFYPVFRAIADIENGGTGDA